MEHLSLWHDGRFAECIYLQTALMNMLMRHFVAREVKLRLMNSKFVRDTIAKEVFQPNFKSRMKTAIAAPDSPDAKKLRKLFEKIFFWVLVSVHIRLVNVEMFYQNCMPTISFLDCQLHLIL